MADDQKRRSASPAGWKGAAAHGPKKGPAYGWKPQGGDAPVGQRGRRVRQLLILLGGIGCAALIVVLVKLLQQPPRAGLALVGADPAADGDRFDAPLDVYGWLGGKRLAQWATTSADQEQTRWGKLTPAVIGDDIASLKAEDFTPWADRLAAAKADPLVVYFGMNGGADTTGPYLTAAGGSRLDLKMVIEKFAGSAFRGRQVVLVVDPARTVCSPQLGRLHNDCVRELVRLEPTVRSAESKLVVLCGCAPAQRGWDSEEWRASAFTQSLLEGLRGAAAPSGTTSITAWDLFQYARRHTSDWAGANRPTTQTPILLPDADAAGRDRAAAITVAVRPVDAPAGGVETAPGVSFKAPDELMARWTECHRLSQAIPSPAAYTPRLWRRYRELLLRYEYLVRAEERGAAGKLAQILQDAERELEERRALGRVGGSRGNALPMSLAFGGVDSASWTQTQESTFGELWNARTNEAERTKQIAAIRAAGATPRLFAFLLRRAADVGRPPEEFVAAADLLAYVAADDPGSPRPAEAHFVLMIRAFDWGADKPAVDLLRLAVGTRLLAEQAALAARPADGDRTTNPYSERVVQANAIAAADELRRVGEDLLFTSTATWPECQSKFAAAKSKYEEALGLERVRQEANAVRDRAFADLPFITRWLAAERLDAARVRDLDDLWAKLHALDKLLIGSTPQTELAAATDAVRGPLDGLRDQLDRAGQAAREFSVLQKNWMQIENLLATPMIEPILRRQLLDLSRSMSARLNAETTRPKDAPTAAPDEPAREFAQRQGRLAIAELFAPDDKDGATLRALVDFPATGWELPAARAGEQMASAWKGLLAPTDDADKAERLSRSAIAFAPGTGPEPATVNRAKRWQRLLGELARRTAIDHWYAENGEPYFRGAARRYLTDAAAIVETPLPDLEALNKLIDTTSLKLEGPAALDWTSELNRELIYTIAAPPTLPAGGFVALWPSILSGPLSMKPVELPRQPIAPAGARRAVQLRAAPDATDARIPVVMHGYFRGQKLTRPTDVRLERTPNTIYQRYDPPVDAGFAVRAADDLRLGAIAIVVDLTGTMAEVSKGNKNWQNPGSKVKQELKVLEQVLATLPRGTPLSIRAFGHLEPPRAPAGLSPDEREVFLARGTPSERIFIPQGSVTWSAENPDPLRNLMERLGALEPQWFTPLVRTMIQANDNDFPEKYIGPKTLLVLTDGADNTHMPAERGPRVRQEFEDAFGRANVSVQMVLFRVDPKEEETARNQFAGVSKFKLPGRLWEANDPAALAEKIELALRPRVRLLVNGEPAAGVPPTGLPANRARDDLAKLRPSGPILPRLYDVFVNNEQIQMWLNRGERLLIRLLRNADGVQFRRDLFADEFRAERRKAEGDWVLGVPQLLDDPTPQAGRIRVMATLETTKGQTPGRGGVLKQTSPSFALWEIAPLGPGDPKYGLVRAASLPGYPAPAWELVVNDWPSDQPRKVRLTAYVGTDPPTGRRVPVAMERALAGGFEQTIDIDGRPVTVRVSHEDHPLRTAENQPAEPLPVPCLVIRATHAPDRPVMVQLGAIKTEGVEHRFYKAAGAYTGLYGPMTRDQAAVLTLELDVLSLNALKESATKLTIELPPPLRGEPRPPPLKLAPADEDK